MLNKPDISEVLKRQGVELSRKGRNLWALCPLPGHTENTASFKVDPEKQQFHCFGCGTGGDSISLIMKLHGLTYRDALAYLGISGSNSTISKTQRQIAIKDKELVTAFNKWCKDLANTLYDLLRRVDRLKMKARDMADVEKLAFWYHKEPIWEHWISILEGSNDKAKYEIWQEVRNGAV